MQSALPLNGGGRGSNTLAKLALNFPRYEGAGGSKGRVSLARGRRKKTSAFPLIDVCSRLQLTIRSVRKLPYEGRQGALDTGQRKYVVHWRIHWERTRSHDEKRAARNCSNDWWSFKGVSLDSPSSSLSLSLVDERFTNWYALAWSQPRKCILEDKRPGTQWLPSPERETTNPASLYSPRVETTFWQRITRSNSGTIVLNRWITIVRMDR